MEDLESENPFAGNRELAEGAAGFISCMNAKFPNAQALVEALEVIMDNLCHHLTSLTDAFLTGSPEFEEKQGRKIVVIKRYQVLTEPKRLHAYLSPTEFDFFLSLWKDHHTEEQVSLSRLLKRVREYEAAWHKFAQALLKETAGSVHAFELIQKATTLCNHISLTFSAKGLTSYYVDHLRTSTEIVAILRQIAAELAAKDLSNETKADTADDDETETYDFSARARYTQQFAAELIGVTAETIGNWEHGRTTVPPGYSKALRWCEGDELVKFAESHRARIHNEALARSKANLKKS